MRNRIGYILFGLSFFLIGQKAHASAESTGPNGIESIGLGLSGNGVGIGQIENFRPGDPWDNTQTEVPPFPAFDTTAARFNSFINPKEVFFGTPDTPISNIINFTPAANDIGDTGAAGHATEVAGVMISTDTTPIPFSTDLAIGVAPQADLYASGFGSTIFTHEVFARTAQFIAGRNGGNISAINVSTGFSLTGNEIPDGNSTLSSFIDWSAKEHDVLYVVAGPYTPGATSSIRIPADNFNGVTVAFSRENNDGVFSNVASQNVVIPSTGRTYIDLIAPGFDVATATQGNGISLTSFGTSIAAPHVTGTVALLQEHANNVGWNANARRHEVMKAVLMNSADKVAGILGSTRTVLNKNGKDWFHSSNPAATSSLIPLHEEFGAGHLNAKRALTQFQSGEQDADGADVSAIGWDYGTPATIFDDYRYAIGEPLLKDSYLSVTLTWDRIVDFELQSGDLNDNGKYDSGDTFESYNNLDEVVNDLDLFIVPRGDDGSNSVAVSWGEVGFGGYNLEHLLAEIPTLGCTISL